MWLIFFLSSFIRKRNLSIWSPWVHCAKAWRIRRGNNPCERRPDASNFPRFGNDIFSRLFCFFLVAGPPRPIDVPIVVEPPVPPIFRCCNRAPHDSFPGIAHYFEPISHPPTSSKKWSVMLGRRRPNICFWGTLLLVVRWIKGQHLPKIDAKHRLGKDHFRWLIDG